MTPTVDVPEMCVCCTCGFKWQHGRDGSHSCSRYLSISLKETQDKLTAAESALAEAKERVDALEEKIADLNETVAYWEGYDVEITGQCYRVAPGTLASVTVRDKRNNVFITLFPADSTTSTLQSQLAAAQRDAKWDGKERRNLAPTSMYGISRCNKHGGYGFTRDCDLCHAALSAGEPK